MKFKEPVIFTIEGTSFEVDIHQQELRQTDRPHNKISFISDMQDKGNHYQFHYDTVYCCATTNLDPDRPIKRVTVPTLAELDPHGMAEKYKLPVEQLRGKTDFDIIVDPYALEARRAGILPAIDIAGEQFIVDLRLHELRHVQHFFPVISLKSFELTNDGWNYEAFYEPLMKQTVSIDPKLLEFPPGVIKLKLPNEIGLDPVGIAQIYGMDERGLLRRHPIQKELKAEVIPLSETEIPRLIRQNKEQLQLDHQENMQKVRPRNRHRF
ncbi:hypothetical protein [Mucilaginibacter endophyticus]|uniref:hypothetical protein n=1 Tax=Mucilaginibacter endophyticus TaxID=2675003 RepID=UPI000E0CE940|nr:hypothetical protein [Mucilaginibacter endophyticus]